MHGPPTADELLLLVKKLTPQERLRLLRLLSKSAGGATDAYATLPPGEDEFTSDEDPLAWDADGREGFE